MATPTYVCFLERAYFNYLECIYDIDRLVQERRNSSANALELRLFCINPSIYGMYGVLRCHYVGLSCSSLHVVFSHGTEHDH